MIGDPCVQCLAVKPERWFRARNGARWARCEACRVRMQILERKRDIARLERKLARIQEIETNEQARHRAARESMDRIAP